MIQENKKLQEDNKKLAFDFIVKMIREGKKFDQIIRILNKLKKTDAAIYQDVINEAYRCSSTNLHLVIKFVEYFDISGLDAVVTKMENCVSNHLEHLTILKIHAVLKNNKFKSHSEKIHSKFASFLRAGAFDELYFFARRYRNGVVDIGNIIRSAYDNDTNNFQTLSRFIDKIDLPELELEAILYDEMMRSGHIDTVEHVLFGFWLRQKLTNVNQNQEKSQELEKHVESLNKSEIDCQNRLKLCFLNQTSSLNR